MSRVPTPKTGSPAPKSSRRRAREFVVQGLYQHMVGGQDEAAIQVEAEGVEGFEKIDRRLYKLLLAETLSHFNDLQTTLSPFIDRRWEDISPIERGVLVLGACELKLHPETPYRVIINEAIELAKTFGGTDGHKFVNGILDKLAPTLRAVEISEAKKAGDHRSKS